ncbi:MAG: SnoaL-like domain-containing protein [Winogradskyella sp.]|uniref:nuclear transport factor 2 family protein n=1 Tax=Winogradskyella sp. TaxID=1883156 RepID=UPI0017EBFBED|nr:SnoaL-like domain-containing protein [Winogradskyella sp.]
MNAKLLILAFLTYSLCYSQTNTEIFLFDIDQNQSQIELKNGKNLSNNPGYDNQPSFYNDRYIIYASNRTDQTDIAKYDTRYNTKSWLNYTEGGEYSPIKIPNNNAISAVRLDKDGKQRLYKYDWSNGESTELIENLVVAYYTWYNDYIVVSAVIEDDDLNLYVTNILEKTSRKYATKVGRSFHKIPNSNLVSFMSKTNDRKWQIMSLDPLTGSTNIIANSIEGVEDICWLDANTILSGKDNILYKLTLKKDNYWKKIADLANLDIQKITRISVNQTSDRLLVAGDVDASDTTTDDINSETETIENATPETSSEVEKIVQQQLEAYNARNIDAFMATYTQDVKLYNYPNTLLSEGQSQMRKDYMSWFERNPDLKATIRKRIVIGNKVIDEEQVKANNRVFNAVAIYEIENGLISKVTFIQ